MQLEGHVLQPLLLGRAVAVHPLAVVLSIAAGLLIGGIFGALIAVPIVACANVAGTYLSRRHEGPRPPEPQPDRARPVVTRRLTDGRDPALDGGQRDVGAPVRVGQPDAGHPLVGGLPGGGEVRAQPPTTESTRPPAETTEPSAPTAVPGVQHALAVGAGDRGRRCAGDSG